MTRPAKRNINSEPGLLPHEASYIEAALVHATAASQKAEEDYAEAVENSGGDWAFDDGASAASAEAAHQRSLDMKNLQELAKIVRASGVIEYPRADDPAVQVGSRVTVRINGKFEDICDITSRYIPGMPSMPPEDDIVLLTPESPMGEVLLGAQEGQEVTWQAADKRSFTGLVLGVDQTAQQQSYPQPTPPHQ